MKVRIKGVFVIDTEMEIDAQHFTAKNVDRMKYEIHHQAEEMIGGDNIPFNVTECEFECLLGNNIGAPCS